MSHLTDKAIGFNDSQNQDSQSLNGMYPLTNESEGTFDNSYSNDNIENEAQNTVSISKTTEFFFFPMELAKLCIF